MGCGGSRTQPDKQRVVYVLGGPGSGKGTQCANLVKEFGFDHISTGDILRQEAKNDNNPQKETIANFLAEGKMCSSEMLVQMVKENFKNRPKNARILLDGFPRNQDNIDAWEKVIKNDVDVSFLLFFECSEETMGKRLIKRGETSGRSDDNAESIKKRFKEFKEGTQPIIDKFIKEKRAVTVDANREVNVIFEDLKKIIKEKKIEK
jgi:UMP-CMP kinase family protein